ncbi:NADH dehydrogenase (ubiquinone) complex I, assembly factor 6 [Portunus trituberculatus]|uniref:15-cis-phytoene synthase n=1 Tax=Portunus trituberculatus TaxID=210409 RepID=A0A5B7DPM1_PORTR|nr:NADH dehydrogenase (ubiquinone) complex I, assembly factor 6 [Portunus trituberculatus]
MALWRVGAAPLVAPLRHLSGVTVTPGDWGGVAGSRSHSTTPARRTSTTTQHCLDAVRRNDYENFLALLLLPQGARSAGVAVRAFNVEVAQVQDVTSEILIAKMRLQFWRETLDELYNDDVPRQPVALELHRAVKKHRLSKRWLRSLIDAREEQLERRYFSSITELEVYSEKSNSALYYLILQALGSENLHADHAASHLGKAEGIIKALRGIPHNASKRKVFLPQDIMMKHGVSQEDVIRGSREQNLKDVIYDVASGAPSPLASHICDKNNSNSLDRDKPYRPGPGSTPCPRHCEAGQR